MNKGGDEVEWRRFEVIDKNNEDKLISLLNEKEISRKDLILIFSTLKIRE